MDQPTTTFRGRSSPVGTIAWILAAGIFLTLTWVYARTLHIGGGTLIRQPLQTARRLYAASMQFCDDDPAGRRVLTADSARTEGSWKDVTRVSSSGAKMRSTVAPGSRLTWDLSLPAGAYELILLANSCSQTSEVRIAFDDQVVPITWRAGGTLRRLAIERDMRLDRDTKHVSLQVTQIGQRVVTVDGLVITPAGSAGDSRRQNLLRCAYSIAAVAFLFATALCWGSISLRVGVGRGFDPIVQLVLAVGLGIVILGTVVTILGIAGWFNRPTVIAVMLTGWVLGCRDLSAIFRAWTKQTAFLKRPLFSIAIVFLAGVLGLTAATCLAPAVGVDPLIYHLPIAKWLVSEGRFTAHPYNLRTGFPHFISNLYAIALLIYPDSGFRPATLTHAGLGFLWLASVYATGKVWWGRRSGLAAAILCASFEGVLYCCTLALSDLGFAAMTGCAVLALVMAILEWDNRRDRFLALAAGLAGAAAVCKVNGPTTAMVLAITAATIALVRRSPGVALSSFLTISLISFAVAVPMYLKNYLVYHNPLYPFSCGFTGDGLEGVDTWEMLDDGGWRDYQERVGSWAWLRWPFDWLTRQGVDGFSPGPAFIAGVLLFFVSGRQWARRNWPLLLLAVCQILFWLLISPMARFAWPWLGVLTLLACSPLDDAPVRRGRLFMPIIALMVGLVSMVNRLDEPIRSLPEVFGPSSERAYLAAMEDRHAGANLGPPLEGIRELNRRFADGRLQGIVLIDTNMVAYANFPTVPAYDYLVVASLQRRNWWKLEGPPFLSMAGKSVGDDELMSEFRRIGISSILAKHDTPRAEPESDGRFHPALDLSYPASEQFNTFIERCVREGRADREVFSDSTLYTLRETSKS